MANVTVVGSGASGVHFALSLLRKGHCVHMLDIGYEAEPPTGPDVDLATLKAELPDPVEYFLGSEFEALSLPGAEKEYYAFPPSKGPVFRQPEGFGSISSGFSPLFSFSQGGLAQAWTGGLYPFNDADLETFPFDHADLAGYYSEVAHRIGVSGVRDDLARFMPVHEHLLPPLELDRHSRLLLDRYAAQRSYFNRELGCYIGRSRVAALTEDREGRRACDYLGRCLWGCPVGAFYTPSMTLEECRRYPQFAYDDASWVERFSANGDRLVSSITVRSTATGACRELPVETLALAAGTLSTSRIFLASLERMRGMPTVLGGLMDNRQMLMPFVNLTLAGSRYEPRSYQYHQLAIGLEGKSSANYIHGLVTALTTALAHPIIAAMPLDLRTSVFVFRNLRAALGILNVNLHDFRRPDCTVSLAPPSGEAGSRELRIEYRSPPDERSRIREAQRGMKSVLRRLGCVVPPRSVHVRPMGASVHYAGTIPMSVRPRALTSSPLGRSHDFENLYFVDGTTYPFLPAKNITFTLMANAVRVADLAF